MVGFSRFSHAGVSLESLDSQEKDPFEKIRFPKDPFPKILSARTFLINLIHPAVTYVILFGYF